jgi:hypothetical protein
MLPVLAEAGTDSDLRSLWKSAKSRYNHSAIQQETIMPYDQVLAQRIYGVLRSLPGLTEKKMFGGVGYMLNGNMACGVHGPDLIVRLGPARYEQALKQPHVRVFDLTGKPMTGWIVVGPAGCATDEQLRQWIEQGVVFAQTLPEK